MNKITVHLGAAQVISALGEGVAHAVERMQEGGTALRTSADGTMALGHFPYGTPAGHGHALHAIERSMTTLVTELNVPVSTERWGCFLSTTKGEIGALEAGDIPGARLSLLAHRVQQHLGLQRTPWVVSNACSSGTSAIALAAAAIQQGAMDHALVIGVDVLSRFTIEGFRSLHALAPGPCRPFDANRSGTSLGEACAALVLTKDRNILRTPLGIFLGSGIAQDANHLSGPSRTGEGLVRAIQGALRGAGLSASDVSAINAHGTATVYNDAMECIAIERCGLEHVPLSAFKGWFGHTLGAAGILESSIALQALKKGIVLRTAGMLDPAFATRINVLGRDVQTTGQVLLKTAAGFGGINAAILLRTTDA